MRKEMRLLAGLAVFVVTISAGLGFSEDQGDDNIVWTKVADGVWERINADGSRSVRAEGQEGLQSEIDHLRSRLAALQDVFGHVADADQERASMYKERLATLYSVALIVAGNGGAVPKCSCPNVADKDAVAYYTSLYGIGFYVADATADYTCTAQCLSGSGSVHCYADSDTSQQMHDYETGSGYGFGIDCSAAVVANYPGSCAWSTASLYYSGSYHSDMDDEPAYCSPLW